MVADKDHKKKFSADDAVGAFCMNQCADNGLIVRALGDTVAFCPPLIITDEQVDELFSKFEAALDATLEYVNKLD